MDCYSFDRIMSDYIDADLNVKLRKEAEDHLSVCPRCREKLADMKAILNSLSCLPKLRTRSDFESKLMERIARSKTRKANGFVFAFKDYSRPISVVAAVLLLVATSVFVYTSVVVPNASPGVPAADIRSASPQQTTPPPAPAPAGTYLAGAKTETELPDSNKAERPNYNNQIMMVNENK